MTNDPASPASPPLLEASVWISLCAALLYAAGWSYVYHYFGRFGLGLLSLDLPDQYIFVYGFWVAKAWWWLLSPLLLLPFAWRWLVGRFASPGWPALPLLALMLFVWVYHLGGRTADDRYEQLGQQDFPAYPRVRLWLQNASPLTPDLQQLRQDMIGGCYRLLLDSGGRLFLFQNVPHNPPPLLALLVIPADQVEAMRLLPQHTSCGS